MFGRRGLMWGALLPLACASASDYVGAAVCAGCHRDQYARQSGSRHARALRPIGETALPKLLSQQPLAERSGVSFEYRPVAGGVEVRARKGGEAAAALLEWAFGAGAQALTPVGRAGRIYFEHRISYYAGPQQPALTLGHPPEPASPSEALGRIQTPETIYRCFNCHATGARPGDSQPDLSELRPGIECERCHGPGREHVSAARAKRPAPELAKTLLNPGRFPAPAVVQICAECHRQAGPGKQSAEPEREDPMAVRFQPVGLMASKCFERTKDLSCLTCHDPHEDARHDDLYYTGKCLGCHSGGGSRERAGCRRTARENCLPCHMRRSSPAPHLSFVDHRIRVFEAAAPVPSAELAAVEKMIAAGQYRQALGALEKMPERTARWHLLASKAYDGLDEPARAVEEAQAALDLEPNRETHHLQLAQIFLTRNTPQPAYEILSEAQQLFPESLLVRLGKALALKELLRWEEAETELVECLRRKPDFGLAFDALGAVYLNTKRFADGLRAAERYLRDNPHDFRGYYYLAAARDGLKMDAAESKRLLRRAIELRPEFAASHALLGKILLEQDQVLEAVAPLEEAIRRRPDYSPAHYHLALAYRRLGRTADAERQFRLFNELKEKERAPVPALRYRRGPP